MEEKEIIRRLYFSDKPSGIYHKVGMEGYICGKELTVQTQELRVGV